MVAQEKRVLKKKRESSTRTLRLLCLEIAKKLEKYQMDFPLLVAEHNMNHAAIVIKMKMWNQFHWGMKIMPRLQQKTLVKFQNSAIWKKKERLLQIELLNGESSKEKTKTQFKQHSSISVLEDRPSHAVPNKVMEDSMLSASLWELLFHPPSEKPKGTCGVPEMLIRSNPAPHKSKRMLQQTRQLLFDCVREMTETHAKKMKEDQNSRKFLGAEQLGKLIYEKLRIWDIQAGDETNIDFLLDSDFLSSAEAWNCNEQQHKEICCEIGDAILEEIIKEIVAGK